MARTVNRLDRTQMRKLEDLLLPLKPSIESGQLLIVDLVQLSVEKLGITPAESTVEGALEAVGINRPRTKAGGLSPLYAKIEALEARIVALEEATTRPFPQNPSHSQPPPTRATSHNR